MADVNKKSGVSIGIFCIFISLYLLPVKLCSQERYLLILDIQEQFIKNKPYEGAAKTMIENVNAIINSFNHDKIVYVKSTGKALVISLKGFSTKALPTPDFDSRLKLVNHTNFTKVNTGDAFESRELENFLRDKNARDSIDRPFGRKLYFRNRPGRQKTGLYYYPCSGSNCRKIR